MNGRNGDNLFLIRQGNAGKLSELTACDLLLAGAGDLIRCRECDWDERNSRTFSRGKWVSDVKRNEIREGAAVSDRGFPMDASSPGNHRRHIRLPGT